MTNHNDPEFQSYLDRIDAILDREVGCTIDDLPDFDYWSAWDAKEDPEEVARQVIAAAGNY